jgi:ABC-type uncharacterized transport system permease subunit
VSTFQLVLATGMASMAPVLFAALGEIIAERGGVMNVGIEGVLIAGAFTAATTFQETHDAVIASFAALLVGLACGAALSTLLVVRGTDQIVTGVVFSSVLAAVAAILSESEQTTSKVASLPRVALPGLSDVPWVGPILFEQNLLVYASLVAAPCVFLLVHRTWFGLHLRTAGERPIVDEVNGVSVRGVRVVGVELACALAGLGGATLVLTSASTFEVGMTNGRGFIALAVVVLAKWNPFAAIGGSLLFGVADAAQFHTAGIPGLEHLPTHIVLMIPFVVVLLFVTAGRGARYPSSVGQPYRPQSKLGAP